MWVTGLASSRVSPFGHPRITVWLSTPRGLSQIPTSFIGSWYQVIHHVPLQTWPQRCSRPLCNSQHTNPHHPPRHHQPGTPQENSRTTHTEQAGPTHSRPLRHPTAHHTTTTPDTPRFPHPLHTEGRPYSRQHTCHSSQRSMFHPRAHTLATTHGQHHERPYYEEAP